MSAQDAKIVNDARTALAGKIGEGVAAMDANYVLDNPPVMQLAEALAWCTSQAQPHGGHSVPSK